MFAQLAAALRARPLSILLLTPEGGEALTLLLDKLPVRWARAANAEAERMIAADPPDVVVIAEGHYPLAQRLRAVTGPRALFIVLASSGREEDRRASRCEGFQCHLVVPVHSGDLAWVLAEHADRLLAAEGGAEADVSDRSRKVLAPRNLVG